MPIAAIEIQDKNGGRKGEITSSFAVQCSDDIQAHPIQEDSGDAGITLGSQEYTDLYGKAYVAFSNSPYQASINGIRPTDDGNFFINGSECDSVDSDPSSIGNGLLLTDLCPSCKTCDNVLAVKKQIEYYKIQLNAIKDANLYTDSVAKERQSYMEEKRISIPLNCDQADYTKLQDPLEQIDIKGLRLFQQYVTTVHMWNYAVSQNNSSTQITTAPEDSAGFTIQTKRAIPSCGGDTQLTCTIDIALDTDGSSGGNNDKLSVYIPTPETEFKPFDNPGVSNHMTSVQHTSATRKKITTKFPAVQIAGTYMVTVKVLPFVYTVMTDANGNILDLASMSWEQSEEEDPETPGVTKYNLGATMVTGVKQAATAADYNKSKTYPSKSSQGKNRWKIMIAWSIRQQNGLEKTYDETYYYECSDVRTYFDGILINSDLQQYNSL